MPDKLCSVSWSEFWISFYQVIKVQGEYQLFQVYTQEYVNDHISPFEKEDFVDGFVDTYLWMKTESKSVTAKDYWGWELGARVSTHVAMTPSHHDIGDL